jgi:Ca-activated chloride channel family protein
VLVAGWLADALARKDRDVEAGIEAHESGRHDAALEHFDAAQDRLGQRPEIDFDRGLAELARGRHEEAIAAFERAFLTDELGVRASAAYQLGNIAFDSEDWDAAIARYTECLEAFPEHQNAKWNLELALQHKRETEQQQDRDGSQDESQESATDETPSGTGQDEESTGTQTDDEGSREADGAGRSGTSDAPEDTDQGQEPEPDEPSVQEEAPAPMDELDIEQALEQLDAEDDFRFGKPYGRVRRPDKDW